MSNIINIIPKARYIDIPANEYCFGVAEDKNSERKFFRCPRIVGNNIDISKLQLMINYQNAAGQKDRYIVDDAVLDGDFVSFSWHLSLKVTKYKGSIAFIVCALDGKENVQWNTALARGRVLEGLTVDNVEPEITEKDIIAQLLGIIKNVEANAKEQIDVYVEEKKEELRGEKGDTGNVFFASFKVVNGRLKMYSDPNIDRVRFVRVGSRLKYRLA